MGDVGMACRLFCDIMSTQEMNLLKKQFVKGLSRPSRTLLKHHFCVFTGEGECLFPSDPCSVLC